MWRCKRTLPNGNAIIHQDVAIDMGMGAEEAPEFARIRDSVSGATIASLAIRGSLAEALEFTEEGVKLTGRAVDMNGSVRIWGDTEHWLLTQQ